MKSARNRKKIFLVSAAAQVWPKEPSLPPILSIDNTELQQTTTELTRQKLFLTNHDDAQFVKAPRIVYKSHRLSVHSIAVLSTPNRQDSLIFSAGDDKLVMVWSLKTGDKVAELKGHTQRITSLAIFNSEGYEPLLISAGWDERLRIWPVKECLSNNVRQESGKSDSETSLSERIAAKSIVLKGHKNRIFGIKVIHRSPEAPVVASCSSDNSIRVWSLPEGQLLYVLEDEKDDTWILCVTAWHIRSRIGKEGALHGTVIISGCKSSTICVWRHRQDKALAEESATTSHLTRKLSASPALVIRGHTSSVHSVAAFDHHEHSCVVSACRDTELRVWSLTTGSLLRVLKGHTSIISAVTAFDASDGHGGAILVSASRDGANMRVWKYSTGECLRFFKGHTMDINAVEVFSSPDPRRKEDLIIVSGSRDTTVRTWLFAEEKALKVLEHGEAVKIKSMDIFHNDTNSIVVTGADDGSVRAWRTSREESTDTTPLKWESGKALKSQILALAIYTPMPGSDTNTDWPEYLHIPLVISAARNGLIRVCSIIDGKEVVPAFLAHNQAITSLCTFPGTKSTVTYKGISPFVVSGSEDNSARIWSMLDFTCLRTLNRHIFDVTSVAVFLPKMAVRGTDNRRCRSTRPLMFDIREGELETATFSDPIIITGGMDNTVRLWRYSNGDVIEVVDDADSHITCLSCINIDQTANTRYVGPLLVAGDGNGCIWLWALRSPFELIATLRGHADEVRSVCAYDAEGIPPVLVSGSLDNTVKVWNLESMTLHKTIEGHTGDVTAVKIFSLGGSDLALVSASSDTTTRVVFEFMESTPQYDVVMQLFQFDVNGTNSHVITDSESAFPRIAQLSKKEGEEAFFGTYYFLYGEALRRSRADFLEEFLPLSCLGLLKSNKTESFLKAHKGNKEAGYYVASKDKEEEDVTASIKPSGTGLVEVGGLLRQALEKRDSRAVRCIVSCWCRFFSEHTSELVHDENYGRLSMEDMILLAEVAPTEFQCLICSIKLIPAKDNYIPPGSFFLYERESDRSIQLGRISVEHTPTSACVKVSDDTSMERSGGNYMYHYLPLANAVHMDMMYAYTSTCDELDSVEIFNSDVGKLALSYAWNRMGLHVHLMKMAVYLIYIIISTVSLLAFNDLKTRSFPAAVFLIAAQFALDLFFIKEESQQFAVNPLEYMVDVWNVMDIAVIFSNIVANILRLMYLRDTMTVDVLLCICSIVGYFNILYYLRAFETTGPLVSMVLKISGDSMYLLLVVLIVALGFSQAFWIVSDNNPELPFYTFEGSIVNSFSFMIGNFDPEAFAGTPLYRFAIAMACVYMLIVSILLLNLLIALMGDSYGAVKEKGLAQWKLEQAGIITEMQGSMEEDARKCTAVVYFRKNAEDHDTGDAVAEKQAQLEATIAELQQNQVQIMRMLREQGDALTLMKDFLRSQMDKQKY